ncbi:hypothetical protein CB0940_10427 [Cercospora beticola]|uniref:Transcription factor TFIIIC triple barrel domain-containing protein n=1 Tax=Cercospora beticola TaxID=122368 RepID=A0A2G5HTU5_CERBT|nr:hypothetical protein CB0940_10427 [Cercospora beticola]PIA95703.1 hypothetical protein CB0940_10427 [Cercospora beticola]WPB07144.1 hypothetical protein RHO25_011804 [Cercospora beticola]CAK1367100.1 unnamed protein product [Cercospora beticola]
MGQPQHQADTAQVPAIQYEEDTSEWEYEYDTTETEELYFTLDLTTHVPDALARKYDSAAQNHGISKSGQSNGDAQNDNVEEGDGSSKQRAVNSRPQSKLQILDLQTRNPLVKFDDGVYSCYWSTDLGTQFHIAQAGATTQPRRAGTVLDVIGLSQTRLIGKPVTLTQKNFNANGRAQSTVPESDAADAQSNDGDGQQEDAPVPLSNDPSQPLVIPRELCKNATAEAQASFLERLSQIKLKRGETDRVPMYSIRIHPDPKNKDELRKRAFDEEAARKKDEEDATAERPRKRRKRLTAAERGIVPDPAHLAAGRQSREQIGARVGFGGSAPGSLATTRSRRKTKEPSTKETSLGADEETIMDDDAEGAGAAQTVEESNPDAQTEENPS